MYFGVLVSVPLTPWTLWPLLAKSGITSQKTDEAVSPSSSGAAAVKVEQSTMRGRHRKGMGEHQSL